MALSVDNYASYEYDALGQLSHQLKDNQHMYLSYDVSGKVTGIYSDENHTQLKLSYKYDEAGMRIYKKDHVSGVETYYVYDASGNVLAIYDNNGTALQQKEVPVYAVGRIGIYNRISSTYQYELTDHLGNVRVVLNQNKTSADLADVVYYSDYYPYGMPMGLASNDYRYGYQGQYAEADKETAWNAFTLRNYDAAIGRWLSTDPYGEHWSPYLAMGNNPVSTVDPDGGCETCPRDKDGRIILQEVAVTAKSLASGAGINFSQQVYGWGNDLALRKSLYHDPYMRDLVSTRSNAQIAYNRLQSMVWSCYL